MKKTTTRVLTFTIAVIFAAATFLAMPPPRAAAAFVANPKTTYASTFIAKCENQQWFLDEIERLLTASGRSINTINRQSDLDIITAITVNSPVKGSLPSAIGEFLQLKYLFLSGIELTGTIPAEIVNCTKLQNIELSNNALTGTIPDLSALTNLRVLLLHTNSLSGSIPALPLLLENIDVAKNNLTGGINANITSLTSLKVLAISNNALGGNIPTGIGGLKDLRILLAWNCGLTGEIPAAIGNLTDLQILDLTQNELTGSIPAALSSLSKLEQLSLSQNKLTGTLPTSLSSLTKLKTLILDSNKLTEQIPDIWSGMTALAKCYLRENRFTGDIPASLVARQTAGAVVRIDENYLHGLNTASIKHNGNNFANQTTVDFQVKMKLPAYTQLNIGTKYNVYTAFTMNKETDGTSVSKVKLPVENYTVVAITALENPEEYFEITQDENGIYITLLQSIPYNSAITFELRMLPYDAAAPYTYTSFSIGTEAQKSSGGVISGGGGGSGSSSGNSTETTEPPETEQNEKAEHTAYIEGVGDNRVAADANLTREQAAMVFYRIMGKPQVQYNNEYPDVAADRWSATAIAYMKQTSIMIGYDDGAFHPNASITRAEFAAILVRYKHYELTTVTTFTDVTGSWAIGYIGAAERTD